MHRFALAAAFLLALCGSALGQGQPLTVYVVQSCGTATYTATQNRLATMDITGKLCTSGSGGGGGGGPSNNTPTRIVITGTLDLSTSADGAILWASPDGFAKNESIYACNAGASGNILIIKDEIGTAASYAITMTPVTGTIDHSSSYIMNFNFQSVQLLCDGASNWIIE